MNIREILNRRCVEPVKRRKGERVAKWIVHRFAIKGGISLREAWLRDLARPPPLLKDLK